MDLSFVAYLEAAMQQGERKKKGDRTRHALRIAAIQVLDEVGYHQMRTSDVCAKAGIANGSFYFYYKEKKDLTVEILNDFVDFSYEQLFRGSSNKGDIFGSMCAANLQWIGSVRVNAGLMRCLLQLSDQVPEFARHYQAVSHRFHVEIATSMVRRAGGDEADQAVATLLAYALGSMMDEIARRLLVEAGAPIVKVVGSVTDGDEELAELLTLIWYRAVFAAEPDGLHSASGRRLQALAQRGRASLGKVTPKRGTKA